MKQIDIEEMDGLIGRRLGPNDTFSFRCHPDIDCFNRCCRNLNLFLYPYDVIRLKKNRGVSSDEIIDRYVDVVMRKGNFFPDVLLRMAENEEKTCPFLREAGCLVYPDRPDACRSFPLEFGMLYRQEDRQPEKICFFKPPAFCSGPKEAALWTMDAWVEDQQADPFHRMTARWAEVKQRFRINPWGPAGMENPKAKMAFMAAYNVDKFRDFVFGSSFLKRFKVTAAVSKKIKRSDTALMMLGFSWIDLFVWGKLSPDIQPRV